jgi:hypothetical protein
MSILDALKTFKQERESIDDVASLPQTLIMQMAQKGQIPKTDVPMILSRKAEMAQTEANIRALRAQQSQGGVAPTIMEQLMAANAQQEVPQEMADVGIASNPVPEMRLAGGGIIAFDNGGEVQRFQEGGSPISRFFGLPSSEEKQRMSEINDVYQGLRSQTAPIGLFKEQTSEEYDTAGKLADYIRKEQRNIAKDPELFAKFKADPYTFSGIARPAKTTTGRATDLPKNTSAPAAAPAAAPVTRKETPPAPPSSGTGAPKDDYMSSLNQMMKDIQSEREALKGNKQDNVNQALLAAGLGMMAGTSPYAFANIGAGGMKGAEQYAELQSRDLKSRQGLLKEASELAQAKGIIGQRESEAKRRGDSEATRNSMMQKRFEMMDKANRFKAVQLWEKEAGPSFTNSLAQQYKGVKNWQKLPEVQKQIADTRTRFINDALGTMDTGVPSADDL